ncbi:MAG: hypothetical protein E6J90_52085, partial [Deltaproteobacteria bacterium]
MHDDSLAVASAVRTDPHRISSERFGAGERAVEHRGLGKRREDDGPLDGGFVRDEVDRPFEGGEGAGSIAGCTPIPAEPLVEQAQGQSIASFVEGAEDGLEIGHGARRPARCERGLGGPHLERRCDLADGVGSRPAVLGPGFGIR